MSERDFEAAGRQFKLNKIDAFKQFHIVRRLGPILGDIVPVMQKIHRAINTKPDSMTEEQQFEVIAQIASPVMNGLAKLSDEDANTVLLGLCSAVEMYQPQSNSWSKVATQAGLMFQDLELPVLLQIAGHAFVYNLQSFFSLAPQVSPGGK